jgi:hypothetical protein
MCSFMAAAIALTIILLLTPGKKPQGTDNTAADPAVQAEPETFTSDYWVNNVEFTSAGDVPVIHSYVPWGSPRRPGEVREIRYLTIHETDNRSSGADAQAHNSLLLNDTTNSTGWHYTVDDHVIYHNIPDNEIGWNAGDNRTKLGGNINGIPIISYHVARHMAKFEGMNRVEGKADIKALDGAEVDCLAGTDGQTVRVMVYNFKNTLNYKRAIDFAIRIQTPWSGNGRVEVKSYRISDDCNFFDEWIKDREELGINNTAFGWSPDDPLLDTSVTLQSPSARQKYNNLKSKYTVCARLLPDTTFEELQDGVLILDERLEGSNVLFLEIKPI